MSIEDLHRQAEWLRSAEPSKALRGYEEEQTRKLLDDAAQLLKAAANEQQALQHELEKLRSAAGEDSAGKEAIGKALLAATRAGEEVLAEARASAERITAEADAEVAAMLERATAAGAEQERETVAAREKAEAELAAARAAFEEETASVRAELEHEAAAAHAEIEQATTAARAAIEEENAATRAELERERARLEQEQGALQELLDSERKRMLEAAQLEANAIVNDARHDVERERLLLAEKQRRFVEIAQSALEQLEGLHQAIPGSGDRELLADLLPPADDRGDQEQQDGAGEAEPDMEPSPSSTVASD